MFARPLAVVTAALAFSACVGSSTPGPSAGGAFVLDGNGNPGVGLDGATRGGGDGGATAGDGGGSGGADKDGAGTTGGDGGGTTNPTADATTGSGGTGGPKVNAKYAGYPSEELRVRIVGPSGRGHAIVSGSIVEVAGVLFGGADSVTWTTEAGGSGAAHGAPFFQTDPIALVAGDNVVTVTAKNAKQTVTDTLVITYNPAFTFQDRLRANPRVAKAGKTTAIHAVAAIGKATNVVKGSVKLLRVDADGNTLTTFGEMTDDGALNTSGDEIKGDGLYTRKITVNDAQPGTARLRATVQVSLNGQTMTAYSDVLAIDVVAEVASAECTDALQALAAAKKVADGGPSAVVDALKANPAVDEAGSGPGGSAWVRFKSGLLGAVPLVKPGNRGATGDSGASTDNLALATVQVQSKRALLLDPYAAEFGADEISAFSSTLQKTKCPAYTPDAHKDDKADFRWLRNLYHYGIVAIASHGDALFADLSPTAKAAYDWRHPGAQEVVWTGHKVNCSYFGSVGSGASCSETKACGPELECVINQSGGNGVCVDHLTADVRRGRVVLGADGTYGILPTFVKRHAEEPYPRSLVYLGACRSLWNGSMAGEFFAAGAAAVAGFNGAVSNEFATKWGTTFLQNIVEGKKLSGVAHVQLEDAANPGTWFQLVGAQNLDAFHSDILNPSWETGNLQGWIKSGDGRVISRLGSTVPVAGKFMGIISTGLGYTAQVGKVEQRFCIPSGKTKFSFWWKYYSEEFKEYCGSPYQDAFTARLDGVVNGKAASITVVNAKVDDLCDGGGQFKGLTPADVSFDKGGVFMTPWVMGSKDISPFAGNGSVLLSFFATDVGDSIYDTAVLFDKVDFE
ncbi:MAG: hypothetical protein FJ100_03045 [Deltaproteobacteria bacterium]|nr:hypothetical protein [Deltaproteobacteria bacterium]